MRTGIKRGKGKRERKTGKREKENGKKKRTEKGKDEGKKGRGGVRTNIVSNDNPSSHGIHSVEVLTLETLVSEPFNSGQFNYLIDLEMIIDVRFVAGITCTMDTKHMSARPLEPPAAQTDSHHSP